MAWRSVGSATSPALLWTTDMLLVPEPPGNTFLNQLNTQPLPCPTQVGSPRAPPGTRSMLSHATAQLTWLG